MICDLERTWQGLGCPLGKVEEIFWHNEGASRREHISALGLKVRATGSRVWVWDYRNAGGQKRRRTYGSPDDGISFDDALRHVLQDRHAISIGHDPAAVEQEAQGRTMDALLSAYVAELEYGRDRNGERRRPNYVGDMKAKMEVLRARWGHRPAASIDRAAISTLLDAYNDRPAMQRSMQAAILSMFGFAADRYGMANPARDMKPRGGSREAVRYLDDDELRLAIPAMYGLGYPRGTAMLLALYTGARRQEICELQWAELDLDDALWLLPRGRSKNRKTHALPLSAPVVELLREAATHRLGRYVLHRQGRDLPIDDAVVNALPGIADACRPATEKRLDPEQREPFGMHDLRRTAGTHLGALGCPLEVIQQVLNHSSIGGVTARYVRTDPVPRMREWLDELAAHYARLLRAGEAHRVRGEATHDPAPANVVPLRSA